MIGCCRSSLILFPRCGQLAQQKPPTWRDVCQKLVPSLHGCGIGLLRVRLPTRPSVRAEPALTSLMSFRGSDPERMLVTNSRSVPNSVSGYPLFLRSQRHPWVKSPATRAGRHLVDQLEKVVRSEFDLLVAPLGGAVVAGDDP